MTKVFIITVGEYSDYSIVAVFVDDKKAAEAFVEQYNRGKRWPSQQAEIEVWDGYDGPMEIIPQYAVSILLEAGQRHLMIWPTEADGEMDLHEGTMHVRKGSRPRIKVDATARMITISGPDRDKVLKVARDRVAKLKAEEAGL